MDLGRSEAGASLHDVNQSGADRAEVESQSSADIAGTDRPVVPLSSMGDLLARRRARRGRVALVLALLWISVTVAAALFADLLPLRSPGSTVPDLPARSAPRLSFNEPLGTDSIGRSVTSRIVHGARQSLLIGVVSVTMAMIAGLTLGMVAGYLRGVVDAVIRTVVDAMLALPALVVLLAVASVGRRSVTTLVVGLGIVLVPVFARLARATTLSQAQREYVTAARAMGASHRRILGRELLPHVLLATWSYACLVVALVIVIEGSLSFLGLGIPPPSPSWGGMVNDGRPFLQDAPFLLFVPSACLLFTVLSLTIIGDRARERFDPAKSVL